LAPPKKKNYRGIKVTNMNRDNKITARIMHGLANVQCMCCNIPGALLKGTQE
jgi:hypothetical protein